MVSRGLLALRKVKVNGVAAEVAEGVDGDVAEVAAAVTAMVVDMADMDMVVEGVVVVDMAARGVIGTRCCSHPCCRFHCTARAV